MGEMHTKKKTKILKLYFLLYMDLNEIGLEVLSTDLSHEEEN